MVQYRTCTTRNPSSVLEYFTVQTRRFRNSCCFGNKIVWNLLRRESKFRNPDSMSYCTRRAWCRGHQETDLHQNGNVITELGFSGMPQHPHPPVPHDRWLIWTYNDGNRGPLHGPGTVQGTTSTWTLDLSFPTISWSEKSEVPTPLSANF